MMLDQWFCELWPSCSHVQLTRHTELHTLNSALCPRAVLLPPPGPSLSGPPGGLAAGACCGRDPARQVPRVHCISLRRAPQHSSLSASGANPLMTSSTQATQTPKVAVNDIGSEEAFLAAIDQTIKYFNDGDIVEGTVVKVDRDEVLLDIGYKTEGVIPSRELSIKHDVDPHDVVKTGEQIEALVLQKEDKEGRLILSKKRAQYERAWGTIEKIKEEDGVVTGTVIEVVKGGLILDIGLRGFLPASLVEMRRVRDLQPYVGREIEAKIIELDKNRNNVV